MRSDPEFPSEQEMSVIYWGSIIVTLIVGIGCFYFAAGAESRDTAIELRIVGTLFLICSVLIVVISKIISMFLG
jgi:hypothetical protein